MFINDSATTTSCSQQSILIFHQQFVAMSVETSKIFLIKSPRSGKSQKWLIFWKKLAKQVLCFEKLVFSTATSTQISYLNTKSKKSHKILLLAVAKALISACYRNKKINFSETLLIPQALT